MIEPYDRAAIRRRDVVNAILNTLRPYIPDDCVGRAEAKLYEMIDRSEVSIVHTAELAELDAIRQQVLDADILSRFNAPPFIRNI